MAEKKTPNSLRERVGGVLIVAFFGWFSVAILMSVIMSVVVLPYMAYNVAVHDVLLHWTQWPQWMQTGMIVGDAICIFWLFTMPAALIVFGVGMGLCDGLPRRSLDDDILQMHEMASRQ